MANIVPFTLMGVALISAFIAQGLIAVAREHVKTHYPAWAEKLSSSGFGFRMGGPDEQLRRRLVKPLLFNLLPPETRGDETLKTLADRVRLAMLAVLVSIGGVVLVIALRASAA